MLQIEIVRFVPALRPSGKYRMKLRPRELTRRSLCGFGGEVTRMMESGVSALRLPSMSVNRSQVVLQLPSRAQLVPSTDGHRMESVLCVTAVQRANCRCEISVCSALMARCCCSSSSIEGNARLASSTHSATQVVSSISVRPCCKVVNGGVLARPLVGFSDSTRRSPAGAGIHGGLAGAGLGSLKRLAERRADA